MKKFYNLYSVPSMTDSLPLERRICSLLLGPTRSTLRHNLPPLVLAAVVLGVLMPLRPLSQPEASVARAASPRVQAQDTADQKFFVLPLRYQAAADLLTKLQEGGPEARLQPKGITRLIAEERTNSLLAQGTPEALEALKALLKKLDKETIQVTIKMRLVQDGKIKAAPVISTNTDSQGVIEIKSETEGMRFAITPHVHDDHKAIALQIQFNQDKPIEKIVKPGKETRIALTNGVLFVTATLDH
ncbi:secretin N-terminal domain-containing protein [Armatimonas sp.]|uniref:secretin N-terminal domain-containing protein n=1 Tax=Armatimonas sp. TaxID=1872638 RepID=UPI0037503492